MERFNVPIPPDDDFPQVICAQRRGEDFQTECVEYVPRWKVDGFMVVDKGAFFKLADMAGGLERMLGNAEAENAKLRELAAGIGHLLFSLDVDYCVACPRDSINHPCPAYTVNDGECLYKTDLRDLGIEVDE